MMITYLGWWVEGSEKIGSTQEIDIIGWLQKGGQSTKVLDNPELTQVKSSDHCWKIEETGKVNGVFRAQWIKPVLYSEEHSIRPAVIQKDSALWEPCQNATQSREKQGSKWPGLSLLLHSIFLSASPSLSCWLSQTEARGQKELCHETKRLNEPGVENRLSNNINMHTNIHIFLIYLAVLDLTHDTQAL